MSSLRSTSHGSRGGGGGEEDGGEASEKEKSKRDSPKKKGKIGRPKNKRPPPPRQIPVEIVPRPSPGSQDDQSPGRSPEPRSGERVASRVASQSNTPTRASDRPRQDSSNRSRSPRSRHVRPKRVPRRLIDNMAFDECLTIINILNRRGDHWATLPNALISPHWPQSFLPMETAEALGLSPSRLEGGDIRTYVTPRSSITCDKAVGTWIEVKELGLPKDLIKIPIINKDNLGVSIILGREYIEACYGKNNWPPREDAQYVYPDTVLSMPTYSMDPASAYGNYYVDNGEEIAPTIDTNNVNFTIASAGRDYDLMAVGAGITGYDEIQGGEFRLDG